MKSLVQFFFATKPRTIFTIIVTLFLLWLWKPEWYVKVLSFFNRRGSTFLQMTQDSTKAIREQIDKAEKEAKKHYKP